MTFYDREADCIVTIGKLFREWASDHNEHETFAEYVYCVTEATIHGQNDMEVIGWTKSETLRMFGKLRTMIS